MLMLSKSASQPDTYPQMDKSPTRLTKRNSTYWQPPSLTNTKRNSTSSSTHYWQPPSPTDMSFSKKRARKQRLSKNSQLCKDLTDRQKIMQQEHKLVKRSERIKEQQARVAQHNQFEGQAI